MRFHGSGGLTNYRKQAGGDKSRQALLKGGWGDEEADTGPLNPNYDPELYESYSTSTRKSLARLNEDRIDFELIEVRRRPVNGFSVIIRCAHLLCAYSNSFHLL